MRALASAAVVLAVAAGASPAAAASRSERLCVDRVAVRDSPAGFVIAHLYRPQQLRVLGTAQRRRWSLVRFDGGPRGWIPSRAIC